MSSELDFLKGIARALGPDVVGGPVDLAEMVVNLGRAGYGYAGHKMGLLKADQMPEPLAASPGTSEWWAQKTNVPETGTGAYSAGRALPLLVGLARVGGVGAPSRGTPPSTVNQRGAIRTGGDPELMPAHATTTAGLSALIGDHKGAIELTAPSIAITRGHLNKDFASDYGGSVYLIPKVGAYDPAAYPSTLVNRDAYTTRKADIQSRPISKMSTFLSLGKGSIGNRATLDDVLQNLDNLSPNPDYASLGHQVMLKELREAKASGALDTFLGKIKAGDLPPLHYNDSVWSQSNASNDDLRLVNLLNNIKYGLDGDYFGITGKLDPKAEASSRLADRLMRPQDMIFGEGGGPSGTHRLAIKASPHFRSFAQFERDPRGAELLLSSRETDNSSFLPSQAANKIADELASKWHLKSRGQAVQAMDDPQKFLRSWREGDPEKDLQFLKDISEARKKMAYVPSNYAELKVAGQTPITGENWAGAILSNTGNDSGENLLRITNALKKGKVPYTTAGNEDAEFLFQIADRLQKEAGPARRTPLK